jgi:protein HIRA/HIR1
MDQQITDAHTGWILGVAWDPVSQFIATQGADRCVKYWNVQDYKCAAESRTPFDHFKSTSVHFRRLAWMPSAIGIVTTCGFSKVDKDNSHVVPLLSRTSECMSSIKGHKGAVSIAVRRYRSPWGKTKIPYIIFPEVLSSVI